MPRKNEYKLVQMRSNWLVALVAIAGCSSITNPESPVTQSDDGKQAQSQGTGIELSLHQVMDTEGTGKLAATYLVPDGYTATDEVKWIPNNYLTPVVGTMTLWSEDKQTMLKSVSGLQICFGHSPAGTYGIDPPKSVCTYLISDWKHKHPDLKSKVLEKSDQSIPEASSSGPGYRMYGNRGIVKLNYNDQGDNYIVKLSARINVMETIPTTTAIGGTLYEGAWVISCNYTVIALEDRFAEAMKMFGLVMSSYRTDPHFFNTVMQARDIIQRNFYARQKQIMETSQIISQTNDEIIDSMNKSYKTAQAIGEKEVTGFDDYIRGIDRYNEEGGEVSLPSGYAHAWSDGSGKYIVSDDHLYDPNVGGPNGTWHQMEKQQ